MPYFCDQIILSKALRKATDIDELQYSKREKPYSHQVHHECIGYEYIAQCDTHDEYATQEYIKWCD